MLLQSLGKIHFLALWGFSLQYLKWPLGKISALSFRQSGIHLEFIHGLNMLSLVCNFFGRRPAIEALTKKCLQQRVNSSRPINLQHPGLRRGARISPHYTDIDFCRHYHFWIIDAAAAKWRLRTAWITLSPLACCYILFFYKASYSDNYNARAHWFAPEVISQRLQEKLSLP